MSDPGGRHRALRTRALYDKLLSCYRERPAGHTYAARQSGVSRDMAKNAWLRGWHGISWARPLKARLRDEGDASVAEAAEERDRRAREQAARRALEDGERDRSRQERQRTVAEELLLLGSMRRGAQQAAATVLALSPAMAQLARVVVRAVFDEGPLNERGQPTLTPKAAADVKVDPGQAMRMLREWGSIVGKVVLAGDVVVQLGREVRGPDDADAGGPSMSPEEAREEMEHLASIYQGMKEREEAVAADGGAGGLPPGETAH